MAEKMHLIDYRQVRLFMPSHYQLIVPIVGMFLLEKKINGDSSFELAILVG